METSSLQDLYQEKLKKLQADFEFFAHITSHDLRDPLRQARIYSDELIASLNGENRNKLQSINLLIDEVLGKIALLRDFSYMENGNGNVSEVNLNNVLAEIIAELDEKIKSSNAEIKFSNLPLVMGNGIHLKRLFFALIDNAIKFRNPDKKLFININVEDEGENWHFVVSDNGVGLEEVYRELVFVLFQRLNPEIMDGSFGAGLAFAKKISENHGGKIWYKSDGESGTHFHFSLGK